MNTAESILALVLTLAAGAVGGTFWGKHLERKNQDADTVARLEATLTAHSDLAKRSSEASQAIRTATARLQQAQSQNLKDFRHELQSTAVERVGCVFPAGVMRSISDARDRAATAAAYGIVDPVPAATTGPTDDR